MVCLRFPLRARRIAALAMLAIGGYAPAIAEDAADRFALQRMADGYIRIDKTGGATDYCAVRAGGLVCAPAVEERAVYEKRIADLAARIAALETQLGQTGAPRSGGKAAEPPAAKSQEEERFERSMNFAERALRRFFEVIRDLKAEIGKTAG